METLQKREEQRCKNICEQLNSLRLKYTGADFAQTEMTNYLNRIPNVNSYQIINRLKSKGIVIVKGKDRAKSGRPYILNFKNPEQPILLAKIMEIENARPVYTTPMRNAKTRLMTEEEIENSKYKENRKRYLLQAIQLCQIENKFEYENIFQKYYNGEDDLIKTLRLVEFPDIRFEEINKNLLGKLDKWLIEAIKKRSENAYITAKNRLKEESDISDLKRIESKLDKIIKYLEL